MTEALWHEEEEDDLTKFGETIPRWLSMKALICCLYIASSVAFGKQHASMINNPCHHGMFAWDTCLYSVF